MPQPKTVRRSSLMGPSSAMRSASPLGGLTPPDRATLRANPARSISPFPAGDGVRSLQGPCGIIRLLGTKLCRRGTPTLFHDKSTRRSLMITRQPRAWPGFLLAGLLSLLCPSVPAFAQAGDYGGPLYTSAGQVEVAQRVLRYENLLRPGRYTAGRMD